MKHLLKGKVALVTGCDRGIGYAICQKIAQAGGTVYANILEEKSADALLELEATVQEGKVIPVCFDITDKKASYNCILKIKKESGKLDVLVNNAGVIHDGLLEMMNEEALRKTFEVNVFGTFFVTQAAVKLMKRNPDGGSVINVSSIIGLQGNVGQSVYGASKAAIANMTMSLAREYVGQNIRFNAVAPGSIDTDMFYKYDEETKNGTLKAIGMGRLGKPEEVANVVLFLASEMSSYITGEIIGVNGGLFR